MLLNKFLLNTNYKMNLSIKKNSNNDNNKKSSDRKIKSNERYLKDNSNGKQIKKNLSFSRNNKEIFYNNINNKNIPPNTIMQYNYNNIKNRKVSIQPEINKVNYSNFQKKNYNYFLEREHSINNNYYIENKQKENEINNQSKTQRAREYSMKVKEHNMGNYNFHNESIINNRILSGSKNKNKLNQKMGLRCNSNKVMNIKNGIIEDLSYYVKILQMKKNEQYHNKYKDIPISTRNKSNIKSRNKKQNNNIYYKSGSIEGNKNNHIMSSSILTMNVKTIYSNKNNKFNKIFKNSSRKNIRNSNYNINKNNLNSINNNDKINDYYQNNNYSKFKKNILKSSFENDKNNQTYSSKKSIVSIRNTKRKLPFKI